MDKQTLIELGLNPPNLISGSVGGIISALVVRNVSPIGIFTSVIAGGACANYGTEYVADFLKISPGLSGFLIGITALVLVQLVLEAAKKLNFPVLGNGGAKDGR